MGDRCSFFHMALIGLVLRNTFLHSFSSINAMWKNEHLSPIPKPLTAVLSARSVNWQYSFFFNLYHLFWLLYIDPLTVAVFLPEIPSNIHYLYSFHKPNSSVVRVLTEEWRTHRHTQTSRVETRKPFWSAACIWYVHVIWCLSTACMCTWYGSD